MWVGVVGRRQGVSGVFGGEYGRLSRTQRRAQLTPQISLAEPQHVGHRRRRSREVVTVRTNPLARCRSRRNRPARRSPGAVDDGGGRAARSRAANAPFARRSRRKDRFSTTATAEDVGGLRRPPGALGRPSARRRLRVVGFKLLTSLTFGSRGRGLSDGRRASTCGAVSARPVVERNPEKWPTATAGRRRRRSRTLSRRRRAA